MERKSSTKVSLLNKISVALLIALIAVTVGVVTFRLTQIRQKGEAEARLLRAQQKVESMQQKEKDISTLKQQLSTIKTLLNGDETRRTLFSLVVNLAPEEISFSDVSIDKSNVLNLNISSSSLEAVEEYINILSDNQRTNGLIKEITLESLSFNQSTGYNLEISILTK